MQECTIGGDCTEMMRKMGHTLEGFASVVADATSKRAHPPNIVQDIRQNLFSTEISQLLHSSCTVPPKNSWHKYWPTPVGWIPINKTGVGFVE